MSENPNHERQEVSEIVQQQNFFVVQKNELIQHAKNDLTEYQLKLIDFLISKIKYEDQIIHPITTNVAEVSQVLEISRGGNTQEILKKALLDLGAKPFWFRNEEKKMESLTHWLEIVEIYDDHTLVLKLHQNLAPYLLNVVSSGYYTQYYLADVVNLRGKYAILLYQLLRSNSYKTNFTLTVPELLAFFGKEDWAFYRFNDRYLKRSVKEVNDKTNFAVELEMVRQGKQVKAVVFYPHLKDPFEEIDLPTVPLHNWMEKG